jgi:hypothetical protein
MRTIGYTGRGGAGSAIVQKLKHGRKWHARSRFTGDGGEGREGELWVFADRRGEGFGYQRSAFSHQRSEIGGSTALILPEKQGLDGRSATEDGFGRRFRRFSGYGWVPRLAAKRAESAQSAARPSRRRWRWLLLRGTTRSVGDERWDALDDRYGGGSRREARLHRACRGSAFSHQLSAISFQRSLAQLPGVFRSSRIPHTVRSARTALPQISRILGLWLGSEAAGKGRNLRNLRPGRHAGPCDGISSADGLRAGDPRHPCVLTGAGAVWSSSSPQLRANPVASPQRIRTISIRFPRRGRAWMRT